LVLGALFRSSGYAPRDLRPYHPAAARRELIA